MKIFVTIFIAVLFFGESSSLESTQKKNSLKDSISSFNTDTIKSRLIELNKKTPIDISYTPDLEELIKKYLNNRKKFFNENSELINYYFPIFEKALQNNKAPLELKYLPIVESRLNPRAVSKVGATGLWQFMYAAAKENGLELNSYIDERMDPEKSSEAAAKYLLKLKENYNDWTLAIAAYNAGPRTISKAIVRSGGHKNFWNIRGFLPYETARYVPSFIATMYVFEYANEHGITPYKEGFSKNKTDTIHVKEQIAFSHIARFLEIPLDTIEFLNPSYIHKIIPKINNKIQAVTLPEKHTLLYVAREKELYDYAEKEFESIEKPLPDLYSINSKIIYKIKYGDYLGSISKKFGVKISDIMRWNNLSSDKIKENQRVIIFPKRIPKN
ncbi:MAG: transglycosylase SLT domain-containing protein [Flavobacteriaceae bacterium]|jgi:membrane-bound lytic murein transglycosylase D|nr:transglycosylase SLT domain-containing protein [Flavobacteriaceae bacterium]